MTVLPMPRPPTTTDQQRKTRPVSYLPWVEGVRGRVAAVLAPDDYITLVRPLERLVAALV